jgi:hypothetical protein
VSSHVCVTVLMYWRYFVLSVDDCQEVLTRSVHSEMEMAAGTLRNVKFICMYVCVCV